jgi:putative ABC transport system permease protein
MRSLLFDVRSALRSVRRAPLFATLVVLTLALGIGATSAIFSVVYPVLLASPPYPDADRLVMVWERAQNDESSNIGFLTGADIREETTSLGSLAMISYWMPTVRAGDDVERLAGARVSHEYFATLGVRPALGRDFVAEEDHPETRRVVLLSDALWRRQFHADSSIVGGTTLVNGITYTIAGVLPADFRDLLAPQAEIWSPLGYDGTQPWACRTCRHLRAVARLRDDVTLPAATLEIDRFLRTLRERHPDQYASAGALLRTLHAEVTGEVRGPLFGLFAAVLVLLLLACANVTNLFLGRTGERQTELAVRLALGAERARLVRLVSLEAAMLALAGGALGVIGAWLGARVLLDVVDLPLTLASSVDTGPPIVAFALLLTAFSIVIGGTVPALLALGESALADIRVGTRAVLGRVRHRLRHTLVVAEMALAVLLLAGAGLQVRSLQRALAVHTGFDATGVLTMDVSLSGPKYEADGSTRLFYRRLLDEAAALPVVERVAVVSQLPLGGNFDAWGVHREDRPAANPEEDPSAQFFAVSTDYHDVMRIPVLRGRGFGVADREGADPVVLLNGSGAARIFGSDDPLGKRVRVGGMDGPWRTVVGIVDDVRHLSLERPPENQIYLPFDQTSFEISGLTVVARATAATAAVVQPLMRVAKSIDPGIAISRVREMNEVISRVVAPRRLARSLIGGFAIIALVLALGGLYGVMAASVAERMRELGLRAALGATPGGLVRLVVRRGLALTLLGAVAGGAAFLAMSRLVSRFVFGVSPGDPLTLAAVATTLGVVAVLACLVPAVRAARSDPLVALRE